jgi:hypothetical protein
LLQSSKLHAMMDAVDFVGYFLVNNLEMPRTSALQAQISSKAQLRRKTEFEDRLAAEKIGGASDGLPPDAPRLCQSAYKPGSGWPAKKSAGVTAIPLGRRLPGASSNLPGRQGLDIDPEVLLRFAQTKPRAVPIRSCSRWGLPCRRCCRRRGALLPHHFTLAARCAHA